MDRCYGCGEYAAVWVHHGHDDGDDEACQVNDMCHLVCTECDKGLCDVCEG